MREFLLAFYWEAMPVLLQLIGAALGAALLWLSRVAKERWGIEVEARHREALHSALFSGVRAALARGLNGQAAIEAAVAYAARSVPDALAKLGPSSEVLSDLASSKLLEVIEKVPVIDFSGNRVMPDLIRS